MPIKIEELKVRVLSSFNTLYKFLTKNLFIFHKKEKVNEEDKNLYRTRAYSLIECGDCTDFNSPNSCIDCPYRNKK